MMGVILQCLISYSLFQLILDLQGSCRMVLWQLHSVGLQCTWYVGYNYGVLHIHFICTYTLTVLVCLSL